jgi:transcriptional regulator with XRE-family HTH domain
MAYDLSRKIEIEDKHAKPAETFGQRIKQLRQENKYSQRVVSEVLDASLKKAGSRGLDVTYLSKIENERLPPPSPPVILALARALQADPKELLKLAGKTVPGLEGTLIGKPAARKFLEFAIDRLSERDWERLLVQIRNKKSKNGRSS